MPDDEGDTRQADCDACPLAGGEARAQPARGDDRREERLRRDDERGDAGGHPEILRVVARAELHRVHEQAGQGDVAELGARLRPARRPERHHRREAQETE